MLLAVCITVSQICYAISNHSFYELALTILSYSKWSNTTRPTIYVIVGHTDDIGNPEYN